MQRHFCDVARMYQRYLLFAIIRSHNTGILDETNLRKQIVIEERRTQMLYIQTRDCIQCLFEIMDRTHRTANHLLGSPGDKTGAVLLDFVREVTR